MKRYVLLSLWLLFFASPIHAQIDPNGQTWTFDECGDTTANAFGCGLEPGDPVIAFSDIIYGANSGWSTAQPDKGVVITIWGRNFGGNRGNSYVTVNGTQLTAATDYVDTWAKTNNPVPFLQSITFQINNTVPQGTGGISVTVDGKTSNEVAFTVGEGDIFFVSADAPASGTDGSLGNPYDPTDLRTNIGPGDVAYFRAGLYDRKYNGGKSNLWYKENSITIPADKPMALVGYPGEVAMFDSFTNGGSEFNKCIDIDIPHVTVAKMSGNCWASAIQPRDFNRVIGNDFVGAQVFLQGTGIIVSGSEGTKFYGNSLHGARSKHTLDHAVYLSGCSSEVGQDVAYNYIWDNEIGDPQGTLEGDGNKRFGSLIVVNSQESRCSSSEQVKAHRIHHNLVSCEAHLSRGIGVNDLSWDEDDIADQPEPTLVYNNITVDCGVPSDQFPGDFASSYHNNGHAAFFNNTFFNSRGLSVEIAGSLVLSTNYTNNVFTASGEEAECTSGTASTFDSNAFFNCPGNQTFGTNPVTGNPLIFIDSDAYNPVIISGSSALIDQGNDNVGSVTVNNDTFNVVTDDFYLTPRPQTGIDIGAVEIAQ